MRIIGVHDGHNAAACLLEDGVITAAHDKHHASPATHNASDNRKSETQNP